MRHLSEQTKEKIRQSKLGLNGEKNYHWKGGKYIHKSGYVYLFRPNHPYCNIGGYIREHRLVMENSIGRYLRSDEHIHHINGNRQDNRIENLIMVTRAEHNKLEKMIDTSDRVCSICKNHKTRPLKRTGRPNWRRWDGEWVCITCFSREYHRRKYGRNT